MAFSRQRARARATLNKNKMKEEEDIIKRPDIQIFIYGHKPVEYGIWNNSLYTPLEVGASQREKIFDIRDNEGDNISIWNPIYAELTGMYWLWKNKPSGLKYIGVCQYRRRLEFNEDTDFNAIFKEYDIILPTPLKLNPKIQYSACHSENDIEEVENIIVEKFPDYKEAFNSYWGGNKLWYSNSFVMGVEDFKAYCEFLFGVFEEFRNRKGWTTPEDISAEIDREMGVTRNTARGLKYQRQIFGFLGERMLGVFVTRRFKEDRIKEMDYLKFEGVKYLE